MSAFDRELAFALYTANADFFEKSDAAPGKRRRVAGVMSAELEDQEGETVFQDGLDCSYFLERGFFNDDHDKSTGAIVGYPEYAEKFRRGQRLPNNKIADVACTYTEGFLLENHPRADAVWATGLALKGTPRALGFSVQGKTRLRTADGRGIVKSLVRHCAITYQPTLAATRAEMFMKSLAAVAHAAPEDLERAWAAFERELAGNVRRLPSPINLLSRARAVDHVIARYPGISTDTARRIVDVIDRRRRTTT